MIKVTKKDEKWLRDGVIAELIKDHHINKSAAKDLFDKSPLLSLLYEEPEDIFHHSTSYWADFLLKNSKKSHRTAVKIKFNEHLI
jgi:hypothetical protein